MSNNSNKSAHEAHEGLKEIREIFDTVVQRMESWEESMLYLMHNIKKNQFMYSHYPDEWAKNYQSIKEGAKFENVWLTAKKVNKLNVDGLMPRFFDE